MKALLTFTSSASQKNSLRSFGTLRMTKKTSAPAVILVSLHLLAGVCFAAEVIPPKPELYFNDYAGVVSSETSKRLNAQLEQFERDTSNQIVVAIFPKMQSDSSIEDYTVRAAQSWKVGQAKKDNGAVL